MFINLNFINYASISQIKPKKSVRRNTILFSGNIDVCPKRECIHKCSGPGPGQSLWLCSLLSVGRCELVCQQRRIEFHFGVVLGKSATLTQIYFGRICLIIFLLEATV